MSRHPGTSITSQGSTGDTSPPHVTQRRAIQAGSNQKLIRRSHAWRVHICQQCQEKLGGAIAWLGL